MSSSDDEDHGLALEWRRDLPILLLVLIPTAVLALLAIDPDPGAGATNASVRP